MHIRSCSTACAVCWQASDGGERARVAAIASRSAATPVANEARWLSRAAAIQAVRSSPAFARSMIWKRLNSERATTSEGTSFSIAATIIASAFDKPSRSTVSSRAKRRADGTRPRPIPPTVSARRRLVVHSVTTRIEPR